jgi:hypothetical protein
MCRGTLTALATGLVVLATAGSAGAATPQEIYRDLADNGRLDRAYSRRDLDRALRNPKIPGYTPRASAERSPQSRPAPSASPTAASTEAGRVLPFTGLDFALFGAVGAPLLLLAAGMRRVARPRPTQIT